jgi:hypothetical protein
MTDRQRRTMLQMQRIRPLARRQDHYVILGLNRSATQREITTAYRELARTIAPDKNPGMDTTEIFQMVNKAYEILSDEVKRSEYDNGGQREEYSYDDEEGGGDEAFSADELTSFLTAGVKPSEHIRVLFESTRTKDIKWVAPNQPLHIWLGSTISTLVSKVDALISPSVPGSTPAPTPASHTGVDFCCSICSASICKQTDPALQALEVAHMEKNHNAYVTRISCIRAALKNPSTIEQVLYGESLPFPLPLKRSVTASSLRDGSAPPALLRQLAQDVRSQTEPVFSSRWNGHAEWRKFLTFLDNASLSKDETIPFNAIKSNLCQALSGDNFPQAEKGSAPVPEVSFDLQYHKYDFIVLFLIITLVCT